MVIDVDEAVILGELARKNYAEITTQNIGSSLWRLFAKDLVANNESNVGLLAFVEKVLYRKVLNRNCLT
jgi:hypothetical protein